MTVESQAREIIEAIPDNIKRSIREDVVTADDTRWRSGELAVDLVDELYPRMTKAACRLAVAKLYHTTESNVRDREWIVRSVPQSLRDHHPDLTFNYWGVCVRGGHGDEELMLDYVWQIEAYREAHDEMPSIAQVRSWVRDDGNDAEMVWRKRRDSLLATADKLVHDDRMPARLRGIVRGLAVMLEE